MQVNISIFHIIVKCRIVKFFLDISKLSVFNMLAISSIIQGVTVLLIHYHGQASDLPHWDVELPQIQRLLAHNRKLGDRCAPLLHEVEVSLHPAPPLWFCTQLIQPCDSLSSEGGGVKVGFLVSKQEKKEEMS